jgi:hypothetical protein
MVKGRIDGLIKKIELIIFNFILKLKMIQIIIKMIQILKLNFLKLILTPIKQIIKQQLNICFQKL